MSETDERFIDRMEHDWVHDIVPNSDDAHRLFAIARRGAEAADEIERLRAALREIAKTTYGYEFYMTDEETAEYFKSRFFAAQAKARTALKEDGK